MGSPLAGLDGTVQVAVAVMVVTPSVFESTILVLVSVDTVVIVVGLGNTVTAFLAVATGSVIVVDGALV